MNRIAKRLNTTLRKLASSGKKAGFTLGGHGFGKLTGKKIETLSRYYRMALQIHPHDVNGMQNAILASFDHCSSTDDKPQHDRCPVGARSWCFYQKHSPPDRSQDHTGRMRNATCARCCGTCEGGVHPTGPRQPPETVHTGQNAECERKPPFCCVEQMPQDDFRWP